MITLTDEQAKGIQDVLREMYQAHVKAHGTWPGFAIEQAIAALNPAVCGACAGLSTVLSMKAEEVERLREGVEESRDRLEELYGKPLWRDEIRSAILAEQHLLDLLLHPEKTKEILDAFNVEKIPGANRAAAERALVYLPTLPRSGIEWTAEGVRVWATHPGDDAASQATGPDLAAAVARLRASWGKVSR